MKATGKKLIAQNKKARHDFFIEDTYEAGLVLVDNMHVSPYEKGNIFNRDPLRTRKLLLNRKEINKLIGLTAQKGYSLIPLSLYLKDGLVKMELGVARGKKLYDKRQDLKEKAVKRDFDKNYKAVSRM